MKRYNKGVRFEENSPVDSKGRKYKSGASQNSLVLPARGGKQLHLSTINESLTNLTSSVATLPRVYDL